MRESSNPDNSSPIIRLFLNREIGEIFRKIRFYWNFFSGNWGVFRPDVPKSRNFAVPFFQNQNFFQEIRKCMVMQEMIEKILEMREMRETLKNAGGV